MQKIIITTFILYKKICYCRLYIFAPLSVGTKQTQSKVMLFLNYIGLYNWNEDIFNWNTIILKLRCWISYVVNETTLIESKIILAIVRVQHEITDENIIGSGQIIDYKTFHVSGCEK